VGIALVVKFLVVIAQIVVSQPVKTTLYDTSKRPQEKFLNTA
jgi:hypothetical protein